MGVLCHCKLHAGAPSTLFSLANKLYPRTFSRAAKTKGTRSAELKQKYSKTVTKSVSGSTEHDTQRACVLVEHIK